MKKTLKKILLSILVIIIIIVMTPLIVALFVDKEYDVQRSVIVKQSKTIVFNYIKLLKNQEKYSVWTQRDPNATATYSGVDGEIGFIAAWKSDHPEVGVGEQEIKHIVEGKRIDMELRFREPFEAVEPAFMTTDSIAPNQTKVIWGFSGHMDYPSNIMLLFIDFESMIGNDLEEGLANLKQLLEK